MKKITFFLFLFTSIIVNGQWNQLGADIDGQAANEQSGSMTTINSDGTIVVISAPRAMDAGIMKGKVRVFEWNGASWIQKGSDIVGTNQGDVFGDSISISSDGNTIAIGAPGFSSPTYLSPTGPTGYTRIFEWNGSNWVQKGTDIIGESNNDVSGTAVSLSGNGTIVAIGAGSNNNPNGVAAGHCRIYEWNGTSWSQKGADIDGEASTDFFGNAVSINANGTIVAVGAAGNDGNPSGSGQVRVFEWNGTNYIQKGNSVQGEASVGSFGSTLSLDGSGTTFIASGFSGLNGSAGSIKVFNWNGTNWVQKGSTISGINGSDFFGTSVDINADGSTIIAGTAGAGIISGYAKIFKFTGNTWVQQGADLVGETNGDQFGRSSSISDDGSIVAVGTPFNDGNGTSAGHVRVFENTSLSIANFDNNSFSFYPNPARDVVHFSSKNSIENITIYNLLGQEVVFKEVNSSEFVLDTSKLSNGTYVAKLNTGVKSQSVKLIKI